MSNILNLLSEETFAEKMDTHNRLLSYIAAHSGGLGIESWSDVQSAVRLGIASQIFRVGDQLACKRGEDTLIWDIIGFDHDKPSDRAYKHSMTIQLHDCFVRKDFSFKQALFYSYSSGLSAGTYNFTVKGYSGNTSEEGKTYQFTLTKPLPSGGQICFKVNIGNAVLAGVPIETYESKTAAEPLETVTLSAGSGGTKLENKGSVNFIDVAMQGSGDYSKSLVRAYINSDKELEDFSSCLDISSRIPAESEQCEGFLWGMDADFLSAVGKVSKTTGTYSGSSETTEKFFLLSKTEVNDGANGSVEEGAPYQYYVDFSEAETTSGLVFDKNRMKIIFKGSNDSWFLRSSSKSKRERPYSVAIPGFVTPLEISKRGVCPACCII